MWEVQEKDQVAEAKEIERSVPQLEEPEASESLPIHNSLQLHLSSAGANREPIQR